MMDFSYLFIYLLSNLCTNLGLGLKTIDIKSCIRRKEQSHLSHFMDQFWQVKTLVLNPGRSSNEWPLGSWASQSVGLKPGLMAPTSSPVMEGHSVNASFKNGIQRINKNKNGMIDLLLFIRWLCQDILVNFTSKSFKYAHLPI